MYRFFERNSFSVLYMGSIAVPKRKMNNKTQKSEINNCIKMAATYAEEFRVERRKYSTFITDKLFISR
jgi:hypothetical protein